MIALILFGTCVAFPDSSDLSAVSDGPFLLDQIATYGLFQQVHVMVFVGFGFLMVFLKTYSWTAVGYNYLIATFIIPMAILFTGFWHQAFAGKWHMIELSMTTLINADFAAAVHLITFGVLLGRVSLPQLFVIASIETFIWAFNEALIIVELKATDIGGSMVLHMFGAYFGLAASYFLQAKRSNNHPNNVSSYTSNLVAFIGTIFLFMYWPSFNGALSEGASQQRAIVNTYLAICASALSACVMSRVVHNKLDIEIVLNATLAGGVAIGSSADLITMPVISILIGMIAGNISAFGFSHIGPFLNKKFGLVDVCGVHNLHGIPAWISCIASIFVTAGLDKDKFNLIPERVAGN